MIKICEDCNKEHTSKYKYKCRNCYHANVVKKKIHLKSCVSCGKEINKYGNNCFSCAKKIRESFYDIKICVKCNKYKIRNRENNLCGTCYRKKKDAEIPGFKQKRINNQRKYNRKYRGLDPNAPLMHKNAGEGYINKQGYKVITKIGHQNAHKGKGAILEHIYVMSEYLKRPLKKGESIHHKNGIRNDNRLENLELWHKGQPSGQRLSDKIEWARQFLEEYGYIVSESKEKM